MNLFLREKNSLLFWFVIFGSIILLPLLLINHKQVYALECRDGIRGYVRGENNKPVKDATITVLINGVEDTLHRVSTREDGSFVYPWTQNRGDVSITIHIVKNGYQTISNTPLSSCDSNTFTLYPSNKPTPIPGDNPKCGDYCLYGDTDCAGATDGCTKCYLSECKNPNDIPGNPTSTPTVSPINVTCDSGKGINTALGCIPTEPMDLVKWLFPYLLGFGGLAAFGLIVFSGFQLMTSSGDPQKIQGAKETITAAVTGLIFIILSLFLLRLIGVDILGLPGLE